MPHDELHGLIDRLRDIHLDGYWYLATPYSKHAKGLDIAHEEACDVAAWLISQRVKVFCPIAHTHPIAIVGNLDPLDHSIWLPADRPMMVHAHGLLIAKMRGWEESKGIAAEILEFTAYCRPIEFLDWPRKGGR